LPEADIFTLFYDPKRASPIVRSHNVYVSALNRLRRYYRSLLPLMPLALEQFDLRAYDLVVSSESGPAKGVQVRSTARHICYCHTPMRYIWELYPEYMREWTVPSWKRAIIAPVAHYLRIWDYAAAARVDQFVANSENVRRRIRRCYRREAIVIYPPVEVGSFYWKPAEDYYLIVAELVAYKRIDLAIKAFRRSGRKLRIVGTGPDFDRLRRLSGPGITFCGRVSAAELRELYARCRALLVPGEEDFGMTAVEALASGKPVIALARGGALEAAPAGTLNAGFWFQDPDEGQLLKAVESYEMSAEAINPSGLQLSVAHFSEDNFCSRMRQVLFSENGSEMQTRS
jgi:glycosyltransferase involved in cell wall biosynthesis